MNTTTQNKRPAWMDRAPMSRDDVAQALLHTAQCRAVAAKNSPDPDVKAGLLFASERLQSAAMAVAGQIEVSDRLLHDLRDRRSAFYGAAHATTADAERENYARQWHTYGEALRYLGAAK